MQVDLLNIPKEVKRWEPAQTENLLKYNIFLVSNEHVILHVVTEGRNYTFADRIQTEMRFVLT